MDGSPASYAKLAGRTTWTKIGDDVISVNGVGFGDGSMTLASITGSVPSGQLVARTNGLGLIWEIKSGRVGNLCPSASELDGGSCKCCVCCLP